MYYLHRIWNSDLTEQHHCSSALTDACAGLHPVLLTELLKIKSGMQPTKVKRHNTSGKCFYLFSLGAYMAITHAACSRMLKTISLCSINKGLMWFNCINYATLLSGVVKGKCRQRALPLYPLLLWALLVFTCSFYTTDRWICPLVFTAVPLTPLWSRAFLIPRWHNEIEYGSEDTAIC